MLKLDKTALRTALLTRSISQKQLASLTGFDKARVSRIINYGGRLQDKTISRLATALNVPPAEITIFED